MTIIILLAVLLLIIYFIVRKKQKPSIKVEESVKADYRQVLNEQIAFYQKLDGPQKTRFENLVEEFMSETRIEGVGTEVTDTDKVMIASSAVIPIFGFPEWKYNNLTNIILYPDAFDKDFQFEGEHRNILGMVGSGYMNGQMLLSRAALTRGFSNSSGKENAAIHEFVHLIDKSDGATDGVPENLIGHEYTMPWLKMIHQEMRRIEDGKSDINPYALTNEAEFFAVAAEYFFEKPAQLQQKHPEIYQQLCLIFGQNPAV